VLDDSTDETQGICLRTIAVLKRHHPGLGIEGSLRNRAHRAR
jgi:hypothetical protein